jgi:hypothetical protein
MFIFLCRDVRKYAYDFRRGELQDAERRKFEEHVASCEQCQDYVNRLEGMLDAAAVHDWAAGIDRDELFDAVIDEAQRRLDDESASDGGATAETIDESLDRDRLFDRITDEITGDAANPMAESSSESNDNILPLMRRVEDAAEDPDTDDTGGSRRIALYVVAALAAGIAIGIAIPFLTRTTSPTDPVKMVEHDSVDREDESETPPAPTVEPRTVHLADLTLQPTPAEIEDVRVFGEPMANWSIATQGNKRKMQLDSGTVLVEFVGRGDTELAFESDRFTVRVTGTIFYASADDGVVGVVTGSVEVDTADGETVKLVDGQEWVDGKGLRAAPRTVRRDASLHVDPRDHELSLKEAADQAPEKEEPEKLQAPRPPMSKEVAKTPRERLRESADEALREGRYAVAAQYYERMVTEFSAADPANASLRLDLARIYIRHLDQPARAAVHLRRFVEDRPGDPARASAKAELCRIVSETGQIEPLCDF